MGTNIGAPAPIVAAHRSLVVAALRDDDPVIRRFAAAALTGKGESQKDP